MSALFSGLREQRAWLLRVEVKEGRSISKHGAVLVGGKEWSFVFVRMFLANRKGLQEGAEALAGPELCWLFLSDGM